MELGRRRDRTGAFDRARRHVERDHPVRDLDELTRIAPAAAADLEDRAAGQLRPMPFEPRVGRVRPEC